MMVTTACLVTQVHLAIKLMSFSFASFVCHHCMVITAPGCTLDLSAGRIAALPSMSRTQLKLMLWGRLLLTCPLAPHWSVQIQLMHGHLHNKHCWPAGSWVSRGVEH